MSSQQDPRSTGAPASYRTILGDLLGFLARPRLMQPAGLARASNWGALGVLCVLHWAVLILCLLPLTLMVQKSMGLAPPDAFGKIPGNWLIPAVVVIAPVLEELVFRGWQSGRPRALWLLACAIAASIATAATVHDGKLMLALLAGVILVAVAGWTALRRRAPLRSFAGAFPAIYWIMALVFAGVHTLNYAQVSAATLLLVLPQLWAGIMLGFTRQRIGLVGSMIEHASANGAVVLLGLVAGS
ncbi:CPBP family intramembrane metalloprotease [Novosphingobium sp. YJ-S2-02]|uniref:CPBP family intramembrane metalloprotease n=1 Tax=Novosphingobium aureum TaxID=2792964 RepID=A0A931HES8_9SPHN|nr:CPBP family glutamic-type intramembrane protease [Novosphingobium aureum]MBH0114785.1 CPBP family intramembrane metalloprotease [Novosphingobium aureum]